MNLMVGSLKAYPFEIQIALEKLNDDENIHLDKSNVKHLLIQTIQSVRAENHLNSSQYKVNYMITRNPGLDSFIDEADDDDQDMIPPESDTVDVD